jgi:hypothetical protein
MAGESWTFGLQITNIVLGVITLLALLAVLGAVGWDLLARGVRKGHGIGSPDVDQRAMLPARSHTLPVPGLGLKMADGSKRVELE